MRKIFCVLLVIVSLVSCDTNNKKKKNHHAFLHEVVVKEVIQVSGYTYLYAEEQGKELWLAVPSFKAVVGGTYYFNEGLEMHDFKSKELNRTFSSILFLQSIQSDPDIISSSPIVKNNSRQIQKQENIVVEKVDGVTTISELYANLNEFKAKKVLVKGKVTKFNAMIMNKNWIHLEDGTNYKGEYDLILTSLEEFAVGDIVTLEGVVALDIDLGYGYKYKLLIEETKEVNHSKK